MTLVGFKLSPLTPYIQVEVGLYSKGMKIERTFTIENKDWHQLFGEEATKWFGKNCYWIPWKYPRSKIDYAWHLAQKKKDKNLTHFLNNCK